MGDSNADLLSKGNEAKFLKNLTNELSLKVVNQGPINHVGNSHTCIVKFSILKSVTVGSTFLLQYSVCSKIWVELSEFQLTHGY